jgi:quinol monooxygenase YgiN
MGFVQIIEFKTTRMDEIRELIEKYRANASDGDSGRTATVTKDRDRADTYLTIVEFDSWEAAQANSNRPETTEMAQAMGALCDGPPTFYNLDIIERG